MARQQVGAAPSRPNDAIRLTDIAGLGGSSALTVVNGSDPNVARPSTTNPVIWFGTVDPVNSDDTKDVTVYLETEDQLTGYSSTGYDIVLLIGQSNMSGRGTVDTVYYDIPNPLVDQYGADGPLTATIGAAVDPLGHADYTALTNSLGPGTTFARWFTTILEPGRRILLVPTRVASRNHR